MNGPLVLALENAAGEDVRPLLESAAVRRWAAVFLMEIAARKLERLAAEFERLGYRSEAARDRAKAARIHAEYRAVCDELDVGPRLAASGAESRG